MIALVALALLAPVTYRFPTEPIKYEVAVKFEGFLPVFGGQEGTSEITLGVNIKGLTPDADKNPRVESELTDAKVKYMGETLPFSVENVRQYFPKTTLSFAPSGKILKTDAPDISLPIRLPGLDVKRFPDVTYMPIEFPSGDIEIGKPWTFKKKLGDSEATFTVKATEMTDVLVRLEVDMTQTYENMENESLEVVKDKKDAITSVQTTLTGKGRVAFNHALGYLQDMTVKVDSLSKVTKIEGGGVSERKLTTNVSVKLIR